MKTTTMKLKWDEGGRIEMSLHEAARRPSLRDSLWVSLMAAPRPLPPSPEEACLNIPRWPASHCVATSNPQGSLIAHRLLTGLGTLCLDHRTAA